MREPPASSPPRLSVVIPVFNEAANLPATITALSVAVARASVEVELIVVDDGSTDATAAAAEACDFGSFPRVVLRQPNRGRFEARRAGLQRARGDLVLLLDSRVRIEPDALRFALEQIDSGARVWTSHVVIEAAGNPFGAFWCVLTELAWADYFSNPRTTSFGLEEFDRYPKGTTCFLAPRELIEAAFAAYSGLYGDRRYANDDTPLIRWIARETGIHVSPHYASHYAPRATLRGFVRHARHRGIVFVDGHGRRESRFYPIAVAFFPASVALLAASLRRPVIVPVAGLAASLAAAAVSVRADRSPFETISFSTLLPVYVAAHGLGMWQGLWMAVRDRLWSRG